MRLLAVVAAISLCACALGAESEWVHFDQNGKLVYKKLETGERILDFSFAGYGGGGVKIPDVAVKKTVAPSGGDDTETMQKAIDEVAEVELSNGFRGAVLMKAGTFNCNETISIRSSGVVLR